MDKRDIEKTIIDAVVNGNKNEVAQEIANAILNEQNQEIIDTKTNDKVSDSQNSEDSINVKSDTDNIDETEQKEDISLKKFKNPQELLKAYNELEREFTRRSQRLKELEKAEQKSTEIKGDDWKSKVDKFFSTTPSAKVFAKDIARKIIDNPSLKGEENCLQIALNEVLIDNFRTPEQLMQDGQFLNDYVFNSREVKDAIIANYLKDIANSTPPSTLSSGGVDMIAPNLKPKSIHEAGLMFLKNNK